MGVSICTHCGKEFTRNNNRQLRCGSILGKEGCSYKRKGAKPLKGRNERVCIGCDHLFVPRGNNQKYCGGKKIKQSCSWKNQMKIKNKMTTWLGGLKMTI